MHFAALPLRVRAPSGNTARRVVEAVAHEQRLVESLLWHRHVVPGRPSEIGHAAQPLLRKLPTLTPSRSFSNGKTHSVAASLRYLRPVLVSTVDPQVRLPFPDASVRVGDRPPPPPLRTTRTRFARGAPSLPVAARSGRATERAPQSISAKKIVTPPVAKFGMSLTAACPSSDPRPACSASMSSNVSSAMR